MVEPGDILSLYQSTYSNILDQLQLKDLFKGKEASQTSGGGAIFIWQEDAAGFWPRHHGQPRVQLLAFWILCRMKPWKCK